MTNKRFCHLQKILDLHHSLLEPVPAQAQAQAKTDTPSFHDGDCNHVKLSSPRVEIGKLKEPASAIDLITELFVSDASKRSIWEKVMHSLSPLMPAVSKSKGSEYLIIWSHNFWEKGLVHQKCNDSFIYT
eukprot:134960_1